MGELLDHLFIENNCAAKKMDGPDRQWHVIHPKQFKAGIDGFIDGRRRTECRRLMLGRGTAPFVAAGNQSQVQTRIGE